MDKPFTLFINPNSKLWRWLIKKEIVKLDIKRISNKVCKGYRKYLRTHVGTDLISRYNSYGWV